jgi:trehalose 6-phosphate phosphatase
MNVLREGVDVDDFFHSQRGCRRRLLMLDYDGTLAPFVADRGHAFPWPGVRERLDALMSDESTILAIVTGRAVHDITPLLDLHPSPEIWGSHGWEHLDTSGEYTPPTPTDEQRHALEDLLQLLKSQVHIDHIEQKPASIAVHWRGLPLSRQETLAGQLSRSPLFPAAALTIHAFDGGLEWRIPGRSKGDAVAALLSTHQPCSSAYLGDDRTDEDAFAALGTRGLRVQIRDTETETLADIRLRPPEELLSFLDQWLARSS